MSERQGAFAFLRSHPDFRRYFLGLTLVQIAAQIEAVTIGWQVYTVARLTRSEAESALLVGMVGLAQFLPLFCLGLIAGTTADRMDRHRIVMLALAANMVCDLGLITVALMPVPHLGLIFAIAAVFGAARAWLTPAATAIVPMLVPRRDMARAISMRSLAWQAAVIIGPWFGGMLVAHSSAAAYGVAAVLYLGGILWVMRLQTSTMPEARPGKRLQQIREGLVYVWTNKIILGAMSLDLFAVLLGGATALLPAFASDVLEVGPQGFGLLRSGPAIGAAAMALWLAHRPIQRQAGVKMFLAVAGFGLATLVFALSQSLWLSLVALAVLGAADMISVFVRQTLVQVVTPDHMRGRVSSVSALFISGSNELGEFESGVAARVFGLVGAAVFGGIGTLAVTGVWAWLFPALRRADRLDGTDQPPLAPIPAATAASSPVAE